LTPIPAQGFGDSLVAKSQRAKSARRRSRRRIPLTITLDANNYDFVESCAALKAFRSVDELFDAALTIYQQHTRALLAYTEMQSDKGLTRDEILRSIKCEILFTRSSAPPRSTRRL
jgi:hypothetical protein